MTDQIYDTLELGDDTYHITAVKGATLFDPREHNVEPVQFMTTCRRGYYCRYRLDDGGLYLTEVHVGLDEQAAEAALAGEGPPLYGRIPRRYMMVAYHVGDLASGSMDRTSLESPDWVYTDLHEPVAFSGGLLVGAEMVVDVYPFTGARPGYVFGSVSEMLFDGGRLTQQVDRSPEVARLRAWLPPMGGATSGEGRWKQWLTHLGYPAED